MVALPGWSDPAEDGESLADSPAADSLADSLASALPPITMDNVLPPLSGLQINDLALDGPRLWLCGDSGLVAYSTVDTVWHRVSGTGAFSFSSISRSPQGIFCAGDSGKVARVQGDSLVYLDLDESRRVEALAFAGSFGLLCGAEGLLARTLNAGLDWEILEAPLPMQFRCLTLTDSICYVAGNGGFVFCSYDAGSSWERIPRADRKSVQDLFFGASGLHVLTIDGRVEQHQQEGWRTLASTPWGDGNFLLPLQMDGIEGWLVGGSAGRLCWVPSGEGEAQEPLTIRLDRYSSLIAALPRQQEILLAGSWGLLATWESLPQSLPQRVEHDLFGVEAAEIPEAELVLDEDALSLQDSLEQLVDSLGQAGPRYLFSMMDTPPQSTESATRMRQLVSSFYRAKALGVYGQAVVAVDLDYRGALENAQVLSTVPAHLGLEENALEVVRGMSFSPGFVEGKIVPARILQRIQFLPAKNQNRKWYLGEVELDGGVDTLLTAAPVPGLSSDIKKLLKKMSFPLRARRYHWQGEAIVQYRLHADGSITDAQTLWEEPEDYEFGRHALSILEKLEQDISGERQLPEGYCYHLIQHLRFDQKGKRKARREDLGPEYFVETLFSEQLPAESTYQDALPDIALLIEEYGLPVGEPGTQQIEATVVLAPDGGLMDVTLNLTSAAEAGISEDNLQLLRDLMLLFTWGYTEPDEDGGGSADTVRVQFDPAALDTTGARIRPLFEDVEY